MAIRIAFAVGASSVAMAQVYADEVSAPTATAESAAAPQSQAPAPLGIFGASLPSKGKLVVSVNETYAKFSGSLVGTQSVTPQYAVTNIVSPSTPASSVSHVVRNDPNDNEIFTDTIGFTYGLTADVALSAKISYFHKTQHVDVFSGMSGSTLLGMSETSSSGWGDTSVSGIWHVWRDGNSQLNVNMGLVLPTGNTDVTSYTFNNSGVYSTKRAVYTLQLGHGTYDILPGITYSTTNGPWSWGASYQGDIPLDYNQNGYRWGNYHAISGWNGYTWTKGLESTVRLTAELQGAIAGSDPAILGYGPCSVAAWYGGKYVTVFPGVVISGDHFGVPSASFGVEVGLPIYQDLNGLHTARQYSVSAGLKYGF
jgi:hypothetical protein